MAVYKRGGVWWMRFKWLGEEIRESTKTSNKRAAEQIESSRRTALAKGEAGIKPRKRVPTLKEFAAQDFGPYTESRFQNKPKTLEYYRTGLKNLTEYPALANCALDEITADKITGFIAIRRERKLEVSTINRQLEVLRRMLKLAMDWKTVDKVLPKVEMLPGEKRRERVLSGAELDAYLEAATAVGNHINEDYRKALEGIRAAQRGKAPIQPADPYLLRDAATILIDCGLRPEECFRIRWDELRDGDVHVAFGKTLSARRIIPLTDRANAVIEMRRKPDNGEFVFPADTKSGHIEKSTLKKPHAKACAFAKISDCTLYTFRHTCITGWAEFMDPYTLAYLAGHSDFATTKRYVHPQTATIRAAMDRARDAQRGHKNGHNREAAAEGLKPSTAVIQ